MVMGCNLRGCWGFDSEKGCRNTRFDHMEGILSVFCGASAMRIRSEYVGQVGVETYSIVHIHELHAPANTE